jgi:hypothetical protein
MAGNVHDGVHGNVHGNVHDGSRPRISEKAFDSRLRRDEPPGAPERRRLAGFGRTLIGWRDYSPAARGMQAALPYVDLFAPAHDLASLPALEPYLARIR